ncbi:IclR family transcriptional regulator [Sodalis praecaptivus]|uniref:IclR family transcriptional regulator n=1 Tax=Sodalis praecaptivus TaxID=1239307 RepID=UPI00280BC692|nr:IclR family transcriptional regulator [Sodalis praecaptivus]
MTMKSLRNALRILDAFSLQRPVWGVRELSQYSGLSPSVVQRALAAFRDGGFLQQCPQSKRYEPGARFWEYGQIFRSHLRLDDVIARELRALADASGETAWFTVLDNEQALCVQVAQSARDVIIAIRSGERTPLCLGSRGKVMLAFMPPTLRERQLRQVTAPAAQRRLLDALATIKRQGWWLSRGKRLENVTGLSVPLFNTGGEVFASLTLGGRTSRLPDEVTMSYLPALLAARRAIAACWHTLNG